MIRNTYNYTYEKNNNKQYFSLKIQTYNGKYVRTYEKIITNKYINQPYEGRRISNKKLIRQKL